VTEASGLVFVLIPGGSLMIGLQPDPDGPNYDPASLENERPPARVTLDPHEVRK
jgi:formylglycine-generating enzyme required for sulfatase activity